MQHQYKHLILVTAIGGAFEMFDFAIFVHFAPYLADVFFPDESGLGGLMPVLLIFAVSYIARPLGGALFSHFGDRVGRKKMFIVSLICMTAATFGIAILPGWHTLGLTAPVMLLVFRVIQGISVGGEIPAAYIFLAEHVDKENRGKVTARLCCGCEFGLIMGAVMGALLSSFLTYEQMITWGWRVPFLLGSVLGIVGYKIRKNTVETPVFLKMLREVGRKKVPLVTLLLQYKKRVLLGVGITAIAGAMTAIYLFLPTYLHRSAFFTSDIATAYWLTTIISVICASMSFILSNFSDRWGRKSMVVAGASLLIPIGFVAQYLLVHEVEGSIWFFIIAVAMAFSLVLCSFACAILELFPTEVRYTGFAVSYNLGFAIFCGLGPLFQNWLFEITEMAPFYVLTIGAFITMISAMAASVIHRESLYDLR